MTNYSERERKENSAADSLRREEADLERRSRRSPDMDCSVKAGGRLPAEETLAFDYSGNQEENRVPLGNRHPLQGADIPAR
jgi:hypothetical protein